MARKDLLSRRAEEEDEEKDRRFSSMYRQRLVLLLLLVPLSAPLCPCVFEAESAEGKGGERERKWSAEEARERKTPESR